MPVPPEPNQIRKAMKDCRLDWLTRNATKSASRAMISTVANPSTPMVAGLSLRSGEHAGRPPKWPLVGRLTPTEAGKNATTADGHSGRTSHGHGPAITTAVGQKWGLDADGLGFRARFGPHHGCPGAREGMNPATASGGRHCLRKQAAD